MDYWHECIAESFDDAGITATEEQIKTVASWVEGAHENYGMAFGHDCIPNPMETEVNELKKKIEKLEQSHETQLSGIRSGIARRRGVDISDVYIEPNGDVTYNVGYSNRRQ